MRWHLAILIALTAVLYFYQLGRPDIITDEASHATRAIGLVDFDFGIEQPTPWQWVNGLPPWWMRLSFHDHPPLLFLLQHLSIRAFGEMPFAARVPSAMAGIASVIFVYLIGIQLYQRGLPPTVIARSPSKAGDEAISGTRHGPQIATPRRMSGLAMTDDAPRFAALAAALLFAVTANHVWISRIGLFESLTIAFMLAAFWAFLRGLEQPRWLPVAGALLGLSFLSKYTALILIPIFLSVLLIRRATLPPRFKFNFLLSIFCFLAIASPVIIYNLQLYRSFGHFDFQFSQLLHQNVKEWQSHPGQDVLGSYGDRIRTYMPRLIEANSPYFLILSVAGLVAIFWELIRRRTLVISHSPLVIVLAWLLPFLVFTGPAPRFLTMLTPWLALAAGYAVAKLAAILSVCRLAFAAFAAFVAFEAFYSYNSVIALDPGGSRPWAYSSLHRQAGSWGFNELNAYLDAELKGKMPDPAITFEFPFAHELLNEARAAGVRQKLELAPLGIVYNDNINLAAQLWVFLRRITYHGWPVVSAENFRRGGAAEFLRQSGVQKIYFINATEYALQDRPRPPVPDGDLLEAELRTRGAVPVEIRNPRGEVAFLVYEFELP